MPNAEKDALDTMPDRPTCPIGPLNLHTFNHERDECIWCGPNRLAWADGRWVKQPDGTNAWSVFPPRGDHA